MAYKLALFIHLVAVITLFGAVTVEHVIGKRLRQAGTVDEVRALMGALVVVVKLFPPSGIVILASGLYMAHLAWGFGTSWVVIGIVLLVIAAVLPNVTSARRLRAIAEKSAAGTGPLPAELAEAIRSPGLWVPSFCGLGLGLSLVYAMTVKPGWVEGVGVTVVAVALLALMGLQAARRASVGASTTVAAAP